MKFRVTKTISRAAAWAWLSLAKIEVKRSFNHLQNSYSINSIKLKVSKIQKFGEVINENSAKRDTRPLKGCVLAYRCSSGGSKKII